MCETRPSEFDSMSRPIKRLEAARVAEVFVPLVGVARLGGEAVVVLAAWGDQGTAAVSRDTAEAFRALLSAACEEASLLEARAAERRAADRQSPPVSRAHY